MASDWLIVMLPIPACHFWLRDLSPADVMPPRNVRDRLSPTGPRSIPALLVGPGQLDLLADLADFLRCWVVDWGGHYSDALTRRKSFWTHTSNSDHLQQHFNNRDRTEAWTHTSFTCRFHQEFRTILNDYSWTHTSNLDLIHPRTRWKRSGYPLDTHLKIRSLSPEFNQALQGASLDTHLKIRSLSPDSP